MVKIKRAYEPSVRTDGYRVFVDRLWPRGQSKEKLALDGWMKELAPSHELRKQFGHDAKKWKAFVSDYKKELNRPAAKVLLNRLTDIAQMGDLTLVYGARDEKHNNAVVLRTLIEKRLES